MKAPRYAYHPEIGPTVGDKETTVWRVMRNGRALTGTYPTIEEAKAYVLRLQKSAAYRGRLREKINAILNA